MPFVALDLIARTVVVAALAYASAVALTHWAVRGRRISPFGAWPRFIRRVSDPILLPLERRVARSGGNPQDAPLWLVGIVVGGGLLLLTLAHWLIGVMATAGAMVSGGPRVWLRALVSLAFTIVMAAIFIRVIVSWFGVSPHRPVMRPLVVLTEWIVGPIRRVMPPVGMFDFSPMVAWLILWVARSLVLGII